MLKKLYRNNQDSSMSRVSQASSNYKLSTLGDKKTQEKRVMKKNYSSNELRTSNPLRDSVYDYDLGEKEVSEYN